ncbi:probable glycosyltransferase At5g03795 isoform X3 [Populus trichocarpa]|uniref:probable glycosyltransferase At5g03795 isoform X3 n=1 Tax=Populus trichocarpa TaxID=3694 RepID=UPI000D18A273|nr:probable glycosyltransferase At5g03795 isoform X3 [Populus trichocarpa]|eukprot:XP_024459283.1 probable glycosyltransferase At5g03795 isoform X3 [Populus trichocarpa]
MKLMVLMVPLILVSGFVVIFGLRSTTTSSWDFIARQPAWLWWGHGNSSLNGASSVTVHAKESDESPPLINGFSPPPQAVEALPFEEPNVLKQDVSETSGPIAAPANEALDLARKTRHKTEHTSLEKLEAGLQKARVALKEAKNGKQADDPDYAPAGPMYWNAEVFHSVAMMVRFVYERESRDFGPIRRTVSDYINLISGKYPFWNRSLGADHFMLACHDWGPEASFSVPHLGKISIRALCNANTSEKFNPIKDVSLPEINLRTGSIKGFVGGLSPSKRSILAFFAGRLHGPIRPVVLEHWENKDDDIKVHQQLPKGVSYYEMMRGSKFCLCPSGYEVASPRIVEALYAGCVPVLISDHYVPPFSDVLNWKSFSVEVPVSDIPSLKKILTSISPRQYIRMQRRVLQVRRHFEVNSPPKRFDVFHMILHSIWLRRLNVGIHDDQLAITS